MSQQLFFRISQNNSSVSTFYVTSIYQVYSVLQAQQKKFLSLSQKSCWRKVVSTTWFFADKKTKEKIDNYIVWMNRKDLNTLFFIKAFCNFMLHGAAQPCRNMKFLFFPWNFFHIFCVQIEIISKLGHQINASEASICVKSMVGFK